jgi:protein involved in temperature-dependent protein secretion
MRRIAATLAPIARLIDPAVASGGKTGADQAMQAMMDAIRDGEYARAHDALQQTDGVDPTLRAGISAFLLALIERYDEAEQILRAAELPALQVIVQGERQRRIRWREPAANGGLTATTETALVPLYVAVACAFVHDNDDLADKAMARLASAEPVAGKLTLGSGEVRPFQDLADCDDAIGKMLETYCGDGLLYFPFVGVRRVEVLPKTSFMDHLMTKVKITDDRGTALAYVPLLYAGSATSPVNELRNGRGTVFEYLGQARRGRGQRDFILDGGGLVGWHAISAIDFD